jgi:hypothetical protein
MNTREVHALRCRLAMQLREEGLLLAQIAQVLRLPSKEKARSAVARGLRNDGEAVKARNDSRNKLATAVLRMGRCECPVNTPPYLHYPPCPLAGATI